MYLLIIVHYIHCTYSSCGHHSVLVHQKTNFVSFNYFCNTLVGFDKRLKNVMAFGTDGDSALIDSLNHAFPYAVQLRCTIHFKRNLEEKLKSSNYVVSDFVEDVLGGHRWKTN